jgi:Cache domain
MRIASSFLVAVAALLISSSSIQANESYVSIIAKKAAILEDLHKRISASLAAVAQDKAFSDYFLDGDPARRAQLKQRIDLISLKTQEKFRVEEMCLIGADGAEIARIVGSVVAYDLSPDETGAVFFAPGFAQASRQVFISPPYVSPDAPKWVVGYATPIIADNVTRAILHFEHGLETYQEALGAQPPPDGTYVLAVTDSGWIIYDSRREIPIDKKGESVTPADYFDAFSLGGLSIAEFRRQYGDGTAGSGTVERDGTRWEFAYRQVGTWTLIAAGSQPSS